MTEIAAAIWRDMAPGAADDISYPVSVARQAPDVVGRVLLQEPDVLARADIKIRHQRVAIRLQPWRPNGRCNGLQFQNFHHRLAPAALRGDSAKMTEGTSSTSGPS